ncbi:hypothetical protein [Jeotgalibacillus terrae]|uniref:Phage protein n=1 Tax=Jeotgalibacillus terrae TaxID=587735 RepID=A0ABW5ZF18_9BACL|nr:hypothetical protein [Jeotgalibacillus terrae]MBM7580026.1 hypothetical protein [Jeotgalibacillus terrae]
MNIKIGDYQVTSDPLNFKLVKQVPKTDDEGNVIEDEHINRFVGYYPNFERVCLALMDHELRVSDAENLAEIMEVLINVKREITSVVSEMKLIDHKDVETDC